MAIAIEQSDNTLRVNKDRYDLGRIVGVQVKALGWIDRLKKSLLLGVVTSSVLKSTLPITYLLSEKRRPSNMTLLSVFENSR